MKRILGVQAAVAAVVVRAADRVLVPRVEQRRVNEIMRIIGTECEGPKK